MNSNGNEHVKFVALISIQISWNFLIRSLTLIGWVLEFDVGSELESGMVTVALTCFTVDSTDGIIGETSSVMVGNATGFVDSVIFSMFDEVSTIVEGSTEGISICVSIGQRSSTVGSWLNKRNDSDNQNSFLQIHWYFLKMICSDPCQNRITIEMSARPPAIGIFFIDFNRITLSKR